MSKMELNPIVEVVNLTISLPVLADRSNAVENLNFNITAGETLCIVGESGSGKSVCSHSIMGLLPPVLKVSGGEIRFDGKNLLSLQETEFKKIRSQKIAMIFQEPMTALNPLMKIGDQIIEVFESHNKFTVQKRREVTLELLEEVGIPNPEEAQNAYPFQLSGGQRQRVMIAMALALEPQLLIADEPTTALDVTTQAQILNLISSLQKSRNMAVMFVTHDFGVVSEIAHRIAVMRFGKIVEIGSASEVLNNPQHDYTKMLLDAVPKTNFKDKKPTQLKTPILSVKKLYKTYKSSGGFFKKSRIVKAATNISFDLAKGETLGIVGESGSGKSTVGRCLVKLINCDSGNILLDKVDIASLKKSELRQQRCRIQMVFQDPYASLNPRSNIGKILCEGLVANGTSKTDALVRAKKLLTLVNLDSSSINRFPHEFSGGQRQRIGIARALALNPEIIVADEAVSALDVSIQAQVLELLDKLKRELNLSLVFITHDLRVAAKICDRIIVMKKGEIIEIGDSKDVFLSPKENYTKQLLASAPGLQKDLEATRN